MSTLRIFDWTSILEKALLIYHGAAKINQEDVVNALLSCTKEWDDKLESMRKEAGGHPRETERLLIMVSANLAGFSGPWDQFSGPWDQFVSIKAVGDQQAVREVIGSAATSSRYERLELITANAESLRVAKRYEAHLHVVAWDVSAEGEVFDSEGLTSDHQGGHHISLGLLGKILNEEDIGVQITEMRGRIMERAVKFLKEQQEVRNSEEEWQYTLFETGIIEGIQEEGTLEQAAWRHDDFIEWLQNQKSWESLKVARMPPMYKANSVVDSLRKKSAIAIGNRSRQKPTDIQLQREIEIVRVKLRNAGLRTSQREIWGASWLAVELFLNHWAKEDALDSLRSEEKENQMNWREIDTELSAYAAELLEPEATGFRLMVTSLMQSLLKLEAPEDEWGFRQLESMVGKFKNLPPVAAEGELSTKLAERFERLVAELISEDPNPPPDSDFSKAIEWLIEGCIKSTAVEALTAQRVSLEDPKSWRQILSLRRRSQARAFLRNLLPHVPTTRTVSVEQWSVVVEGMWKMTKDLATKPLDRFLVEIDEGTTMLSFAEIVKALDEQLVGGGGPAKTSLTFLVHLWLASYRPPDERSWEMDDLEALLRQSNEIPKEDWGGHVADRVGIGIAKNISFRNPERGGEDQLAEIQAKVRDYLGIEEG